MKLTFKALALLLALTSCAPAKSEKAKKGVVTIVPPAPAKLFIGEDYRTVIGTSALSVGTPAITSLNLPKNASLTSRGDGTAMFQWKPTRDQVGVYEIQLQAVSAGSLDAATWQAEVVNRPPTVGSAAISEGAYFVTSTLSAVSDGFADSDAGDTVLPRYQWFVNGLAVFGATLDVLAAPHFVKGDLIGVDVIPFDGRDEGEPLRSNTVTILNTPPTTSLALIDAGPYFSDMDIGVSPEGWYDADGDVPSYQYRWKVNGLYVDTAVGNSIANTNYIRSNTVQAVVVPYDGAITGTPVYSSLVTIANKPPIFSAVSLGLGPHNKLGGIQAATTGIYDADDDLVTTSYRWFVQGVPIGGQSANTLAGTFYARGDTVFVEATASDGTPGATRVSTPITTTNSAPALSGASIAAGPHYVNSTITVSPSGWLDLDGDAPEYNVQWFVNGSEAGTNSTSISSLFTKSNQVYAVMTPINSFFGDFGATVTSNSVQIQNSLPVMQSVSLGTGPFNKADTLTAAVSVSDADGDGVSYSYAWYTNSILVSGQTGFSLTGFWFSSGDSVFVRVTPHDGEATGSLLDSNTISIAAYGPRIVSLSPNEGTTGTVVTLAGYDFGPYHAANTISVGGVLAPILSWVQSGDIAYVLIEIPSELSLGLKSVRAKMFDNETNITGFIVNAVTHPTILGLTPGAATSSSSVSIAGNGFGVTQSTSRVFFGDVTAEVVAWSDTSITITAPGAAAPATIPVRVDVDGVFSNGYPFEHYRPWVDSRYPFEGTVGTTITLLGRYLGTEQGSVNIGGVNALVDGWTDSTVQVSVQSGTPKGAQRVTLLTSLGHYANAVSYYQRGNNVWLPWGEEPDPRFFDDQRSVWTGTEMIVWGGGDQGSYSMTTALRYNPSTDTWVTASSEGAPDVTYAGSLIWTGDEVVVWGGDIWAGPNRWVNTGGKYSPSTDSWLSTTTENAPVGRMLHSAIWTGQEMIVWGGVSGPDLSSGGRYNPVTDLWLATNEALAPAARQQHGAVWTGGLMLIWGGWAAAGGRYDPQNDEWSTMSTVNSPSARQDNSILWTGSEMLIFGGTDSGTNTGGRYNPETDTWAQISTIGAPTLNGHAAIWTGHEMVVWGSKGLNTLISAVGGGRYNPATDTWRSVTSTNAPLGRWRPLSAWTGAEMLIWSGTHPQTAPTGARYNPDTDQWAPMSVDEIPVNSYDQHTDVWTGAELITWGTWRSLNVARVGARYSPATATWLPISEVGAPTDGANFGVWSGTDMIVPSRLKRYNPASNSWFSMPPTTAVDRTSYSTVFSNSEMIIWGGTSNSTNVILNTGARYSTITDSWSWISTTNAPSARRLHSAVWDGTTMIVFGGYDGAALNTGGIYYQESDTWATLTTTGAPEARYSHSTVWASDQMIVWGGWGSSGLLTNGARYAQGGWESLPTSGAPPEQYSSKAVWTGNVMVVFGGSSIAGYRVFPAGGLYSPSRNEWLPFAESRLRVKNPSIFWTGMEVLVWDGFGSYSGISGRYIP